MSKWSNKGNSSSSITHAHAATEACQRTFARGSFVGAESDDNVGGLELRLALEKLSTPVHLCRSMSCRVIIMLARTRSMEVTSESLSSSVRCLGGFS